MQWPLEPCKGRHKLLKNIFHPEKKDLSELQSVYMSLQFLGRIKGTEALKLYSSYGHCRYSSYELKKFYEDVFVNVSRTKSYELQYHLFADRRKRYLASLGDETDNIWRFNI